MKQVKGTGPVNIGSWVAPTKTKRNYVGGGTVGEPENPSDMTKGEWDSLSSTAAIQNEQRQRQKDARNPYIRRKP